MEPKTCFPKRARGKVSPTRGTKVSKRENVNHTPQRPEIDDLWVGDSMPRVYSVTEWYISGGRKAMLLTLTGDIRLLDICCIRRSRQQGWLQNGCLHVDGQAEQVRMRTECLFASPVTREVEAADTHTTTMENIGWKRAVSTRAKVQPWDVSRPSRPWVHGPQRQIP